MVFPSDRPFMAQRRADERPQITLWRDVYSIYRGYERLGADGAVGHRFLTARRIVQDTALLAGQSLRAILDRVGVSAERVRDRGDRLLRPHAVASVVERRRNHGDAELAGRH